MSTQPKAWEIRKQRRHARKLAKKLKAKSRKAVKNANKGTRKKSKRERHAATCKILGVTDYQKVKNMQLSQDTIANKHQSKLIRKKMQHNGDSKVKCIYTRKLRYLRKRDQRSNKGEFEHVLMEPISENVSYDQWMGHEEEETADALAFAPDRDRMKQHKQDPTNTYVELLAAAFNGDALDEQVALMRSLVDINLESPEEDNVSEASAWSLATTSTSTGVHVQGPTWADLLKGQKATDEDSQSVATSTTAAWATVDKENSSPATSKEGTPDAAPSQSEWSLAGSELMVQDVAGVPVVDVQTQQHFVAEVEEVGSVCDSDWSFA